MRECYVVGHLAAVVYSFVSFVRFRSLISFVRSLRFVSVSFEPPFSTQTGPGLLQDNFAYAVRGMRYAIIGANMKKGQGALTPTPSERQLGDVAELMKALAELDEGDKITMFVTLG